MIKKISPRIYFNPGLIFLLSLIALSWVIVGDHNSAPLIESSTGYSGDMAGPYPGADKDHQSPAVIKFRDATLESGIRFRHTQGGMNLSAITEVMGSGACTADYDGDGFWDIYAVNGSGYTHYYGKKWWWGKDPRNVLYRNNGDGTFTDVTDAAGVGKKGWDMGCAFGDYDNDGDPDLYVTNYGANVLYQNNGDGTFSDVTSAAGAGNEGWGTSVAWGDYDKDGHIDIYVANYLEFHKGMNPGEPDSAFKMNTPLLMDSKLFDSQANVLYRNNGNGTFSDVTAAARVGNSPGKSLGVIFFDYDRDGFPDIYVANDNSRNVLFRNDGKGAFTDVGGILGVDSPLSGMGVDAGDYDNDGDMDIFSTYPQSETNILYKNLYSPENKKTGSKKFMDVTVDSGLGEEVSVGYFGWGTGFVDLDNDGYLDIFVANGHGMVDFDNPQSTIGQRNQVFQNRGNGVFSDVSEKAGKALQVENTTRGAAFGDYDNDGDMDIFLLNNNDDAGLLMNETQNSHYRLSIYLRGVKSNRDGIGAVVTVTAGDLRQTREVRSGSGYLSQNDIRLHFGLGQHPKADFVEVRWPAGGVQRFKNVEANHFATITEGDNNIQLKKITRTEDFSNEERGKGKALGMQDAKKRDGGSFPINAIGVLGQINDPRAIKIMKGLLKSEEAELRKEIARILGNSRDEESMFALLIRLQSENDEGVILEILKALRNFESDRIIPPLVEGLRSGNKDIRRESAESLSALLEREQTIFRSTMLKKRTAVSPLIKALNDEAPEIRKAAVKGLGYSESYRAVTPVIEMFRDTSPDVREAAAKAAGLLKNQRAVSPLLELLKNNEEEPRGRARAIVALKQLKVDSPLTPLLDIAEMDRNEDHRHRALSVMISLLKDDESFFINEDKREIGGYLRRGFKDQDHRIKGAIVQIIGLLRMREHSDLIDQALRDKSIEVRREAVVAAGRIGNKNLRPALKNLLKDSDPVVKRNAVTSLAGLTRAENAVLFKKIAHDPKEDEETRLIALKNLIFLDSNAAIAAMQAFIDKEESGFRKGCLKILGQTKNKEGMALLLDSLAKSKDHEEIEETISALEGFIQENPVFLALLNKLKDKKIEKKLRLKILSLFLHSQPSKISPYLKNLASDKEDEIRFDVLRVIASLDDSKEKESILSLFMGVH